MRRILSFLLTLTLLIGCMLSITGCDLEFLKKDEKKKSEPEIECPEGYKFYKNDDLAFAYPAGWSLQDGSITILIDEITSDNITVVYESKTDMYDDMTLGKFNELILPVYEAMGTKVKNVQFYEGSTNGLDVIKITYDASAYGVSMYQTIYIVDIGERTYTVTVTEMQKNSELSQVVFNTLHTVATETEED